MSRKICFISLNILWYLGIFYDLENRYPDAENISKEQMVFNAKLIFLILRKFKRTYYWPIWLHLYMSTPHAYDLILMLLSLRTPLDWTLFASKIIRFYKKITLKNKKEIAFTAYSIREKWNRSNPILFLFNFECTNYFLLVVIICGNSIAKLGQKEKT